MVIIYVAIQLFRWLAGIESRFINWGVGAVSIHRFLVWCRLWDLASASSLLKFITYRTWYWEPRFKACVLFSIWVSSVTKLLKGCCRGSFSSVSNSTDSVFNVVSEAWQTSHL